MGARRGRGFTLVELLMVIVLFGIVAAFAAPAMQSGFRAYFTGRDISEADWQARVALERMTRELRAVRAPADLALAAAGDLTFVDLDGNSIRYCMGAIGGCPGAAGELMRNAQPLASGVSGLTFSFLTRTGGATGSAALAYYVSASFDATHQTITKSHQVTIAPRNFP
jgi:prepilin-type N-terminal cleavage/methylation domain-containing protein